MEKDLNIRMTRQRQIILEEIKGSMKHLTADEVYERVRRRLPKISLGTVYRTLELFFETGLINRLEVTGMPKRFNGNVRNHYHIQCIKCGRIDDAPLKPLEDLDNKLQKKSNYKILGHSLKFVGICPECKG